LLRSLCPKCGRNMTLGKNGPTIGCGTTVAVLTAARDLEMCDRASWCTRNKLALGQVMLLAYDIHFRQSRLRLKCDGTRAETRFRLSAKRTSPFKSTGASVQSTTGSRGVRISGSNGSNAGYTMFRGSVKSTGYPLHFASSPFTSSPMRHRVLSHFKWTLPSQSIERDYELKSHPRYDWFQFCAEVILDYVETMPERNGG
jgi:hypothetical protein